MNKRNFAPVPVVEDKELKKAVAERRLQYIRLRNLELLKSGGKCNHVLVVEINKFLRRYVKPKFSVPAESVTVN